MTRLLVVDDDAEILSSVARLGEMLGWDVRTVRSAAAAPDAAHAFVPDIVLHDVTMPGLDLAAQVRRLRADAALAHARIVVFSGSVEAHEFARALGLDGVLEKPFEIDRLRAVVEGDAHVPDATDTRRARA